MTNQYESWLLRRIAVLEKENEQLNREKIEWINLTMQGEAVRHKVMLELVLGMPLDK